MAGAAASAGAGVLSLALSPLLGVASPAQLLQEGLTDWLPLAVTSGIISLLGKATKPVVLAFIAAGWLTGGGVLGAVAARLRRPGWAYPVALGLGLWLAAAGGHRPGAPALHPGLSRTAGPG